ncbi:MAG: hypothetical protein KDA68_08845, partial [Planctomycetaceae bacterium]|nr:hypothetical protein [Planctomycetaceae bacterium]
MDSMLEVAGYNFVSALLLGMFVWGVTRVWRNLPVAHVLWVIVMVRLIAPPVFEIGWSPESSFLQSIVQSEKSHPEQNHKGLVTGGAGAAKVLIPGTRMVYEGMDERGQIPEETSGVIARWGEGWKLIRSELVFVWVFGAGVILFVAVVRIVAFQ